MKSLGNLQSGPPAAAEDHHGCQAADQERPGGRLGDGIHSKAGKHNVGRGCSRSCKICPAEISNSGDVAERLSCIATSGLEHVHGRWVEGKPCLACEADSR